MLGNARCSDANLCGHCLEQNYQQWHSSIVQIDVTQMMEDMRTNLTSMLAWKKEAVEKIAHESERIAAEYVLGKVFGIGKFVINLYDSKQTRTLTMDNSTT